MMNRQPTSPVTVAVFDADAAAAQLDTVRSLYAEVYAEPPYRESADDVEAFVQGWQARLSQPGFRLVLAETDDSVVGMAFGHQLTPSATWWSGTTTSLPPEVTTEYPGRTFAIIELAVRGPHRRHGVGRALHDALLRARAEKRVTLLARPEAKPAQRAYESWGYRRVGKIKPGRDAPVYDALLRELAPNASDQTTAAWETPGQR